MTLRDWLDIAGVFVTPMVVVICMAVIAHRLASVEARISAVEKAEQEPLSRLQLSKDIGKVAERVGRVEAAMEGLGGTLSRIDNYLHSLIEKGLGR